MAECNSVCVAGGGGDSASSLFPAAGFSLNYASRQPGFVCRVYGVPASDPCVNTAPADAFWGLWWSDGDASSWTYSSLGAGSLNVPDGGMVAFSWDDVDGTAPPSASASHPDAAPTQQPTQQPDQPDPDDSPAPGQGSSSDPGGTSGPDDEPTHRLPPRTRSSGGRAAWTRSASPSRTTSPGASPTLPEATPRDPGSADPGSVADPADSDGVPGWVAPSLIGVLFAAPVRSCSCGGGGPAREARSVNARLPRDLHPVAWWLWALGLAMAASLTTNPLLLLLLVGSRDPGRDGAPARTSPGPSRSGST